MPKRHVHTLCVHLVCSPIPVLALRQFSTNKASHSYTYKLTVLVFQLPFAAFASPGPEAAGDADPSGVTRQSHGAGPGAAGDRLGRQKLVVNRLCLYQKLYLALNEKPFPKTSVATRASENRRGRSWLVLYVK